MEPTDQEKKKTEDKKKKASEEPLSKQFEGKSIGVLGEQFTDTIKRIAKVKTGEK